MNCAEFQKVLPYIIETGGKPEEEQHLRDCHVCSDLVQDLRYIAEQAKLLVPMEDPSPEVWDGIRSSLEREGLVKKPAHARGRLLGSHGAFPWIAAVAALALVIFGIALYRRQSVAQPGPAVNAMTAPQPAATTEIDDQDQQVLQQVSQSRPEMRDAYEHNLKQVNTAIREAKQAVQQDPSDEDARGGLMRAYEQKNMLYEMATQSLQ